MRGSVWYWRGRLRKTNGTPLSPYPLNLGAGPLSTFTWRDTAALGLGAPAGRGIPLDIEVGAPLNLEPSPPGAIAERLRLLSELHPQRSGK